MLTTTTQTTMQAEMQTTTHKTTQTTITHKTTQKTTTNSIRDRVCGLFCFFKLLLTGTCPPLNIKKRTRGE